MLSGLWGKKIGMTQLFSADNKVVPVTVIDTSHWFVTGLKTQERDGYNAIQVGCVRKKYEGKEFSADWLKKTNKYFVFIKEVRQEKVESDVVVGQPANFAANAQVGQTIDVFGITRGHGFQGVVKRHAFAGGPASHGSDFKRRPGGMSFTRSRGRVIKGKKLPGHMGVANRVMRNLSVVQVEPASNMVIIKGSVPGKTGSLVFLRKIAG